MTIRKFTKKPIPIPAVQFALEDGEDWDDAWARLREFTDDAIDWDVDDMTGEDTFEVYDYLHDAWIPFEQEDWILRGIQGEFYPCKDDVFIASYDEYDSSGKPEDTDDGIED